MVKKTPRNLGKRYPRFSFTFIKKNITVNHRKNMFNLEKIACSSVFQHIPRVFFDSLAVCWIISLPDILHISSHLFCHLLRQREFTCNHKDYGIWMLDSFHPFVLFLFPFISLYFILSRIAVRHITIHKFAISNGFLTPNDIHLCEINKVWRFLEYIKQYEQSERF